MVSARSRYHRQTTLWQLLLWNRLYSVEEMQMKQPPPQARRLLHRGGERETRVTGDEAQGYEGVNEHHIGYSLLQHTDLILNVSIKVQGKC